MQRQIRVLRKNGRRGAFALIAAVFLMLLLSIMLLKMLSYSTENAQQVLNDYILEQAQLAAYGATEFAMLQISEDNRSVGSPSGCTQAIINMAYPSTGTRLFDINITVQYIWLDTALTALDLSCQNSPITGAPITVTTAEQNGSAYIDVVVGTVSSIGLDEPIRVHRKTLQKL